MSGDKVLDIQTALIMEIMGLSKSEARVMASCYYLQDACEFALKSITSDWNYRKVVVRLEAALKKARGES